jgi:LPXTG-motif cell wall-anchored protein
METLAATGLSLAVLASIALVAGGAWLIAKRRNRRQGVLMLVAAAVLVANVLIWAL